MTLLENQSHKKNKKKGQKKPFLRTVFFTYCLLPLLSLPRGIGKFLYKTIKKSPRPFLGVISIIGILAFAGVMVNKSYSQYKKQLPDEIKINSFDNLGVQTQILQFAYKTLAEAKAKKWDRFAYTNSVLEYLASLEMIENSKIRFGLDGVLNITSIPHQLAFVANLQEEDRSFLISKQLTVMGKLNHTDPKPLVPTVFLPDAKYVVRASNAHNFTIKRGYLVNTNLPRIQRLIKTMDHYLASSEFKSLKLIRYIYKSTTGFAADFNISTVDGENNQLITSPTINVIFGDDELDEKTSKLTKILQSFAEKKEYPENIDLSYMNKAIIRMKTSDATTVNSTKL